MHALWFSMDHPFQVGATPSDLPMGQLLHLQWRAYESKPRFYELLARLGIIVAPEHWYYTCRATFDMEACLWCLSPLAPTQAGHAHVCLILASNVPGHEGPYNFISHGCPQRLVDDMIACLWDISDAGYVRYLALWSC